MIDMGTQVVAATQDAYIQFCSATKKKGMCQYVFLNIWIIVCTFPGTQMVTTRSKDYSVQCFPLPALPLSLFHHSVEES